MATTWKTVSTKTPASWTGGYFVTMSCLSSKDCWASANTMKYVSGVETYSPFVEHWNGSGWQLSSLGSHKQMIAGGISCASATDCFMVGGTAFNGSSTVRIEHWNGSGWSQASQASGGGFLNDVSCRSTTWCMAVGWHVISSPATTKAVAELWNGTKWTSLAPPSSTMARTTLIELSCASESSCLAIGQKFGASGTGERALFSERWNGSKWSIVSIPTPSGSVYPVVAVPNDLSCASSAACMAVGYWYLNGPGRPGYERLADVWNGSAWTHVSASSSVQSKFQQYDDVSCVAATKCWVVGSGYATNSGFDAAAAYWNGSSFTWGSVVKPGTNSELDAVHCVAGASCFALGSSHKSTGGPSVLGEKVAAP